MSVTCFDDAPEFLEQDNRRFRTYNPVSKEQLIKKHQAILPPSLIEGKTVLDLGCCLGATGHWCLSNGAAQYTGVELQGEYASRARELLGRYHGDRATVHHAGIETWLEGATGTCDIVCLFGVIYVFSDYHSVLKRACGLAKEVLAIESNYPNTARYGEDFCGAEFRDQQLINLASENASVAGRGVNISPRGLQWIMAEFGFASSGTLPIARMTETRDVYHTVQPGHLKRFLMHFRRVEDGAIPLTEQLLAKSGPRVYWSHHEK